MDAFLVPCEFFCDEGADHSTQHHCQNRQNPTSLLVAMPELFRDGWVTMPWTWLVAKVVNTFHYRQKNSQTQYYSKVGGFSQYLKAWHTPEQNPQARPVAEHQTVKPLTITTILSTRPSWDCAMPTGIHLMFRYICTSLKCLVRFCKQQNEQKTYVSLLSFFMKCSNSNEYMYHVTGLPAFVWCP